jgi:hypothetical protein
MLRGPMRDEARECLLQNGDGRRAPQRRGWSRWLRGRFCARVPTAHPTGHAVVKQSSQSEGVGCQQLAVLGEVLAERFVTLLPEVRWGRR